ncbi:MAG: GAF domain-containing protein [Planctomycetes bacterium]|nr:GAF domain-containing protein [Planctomycetota bacterium]
MNTPAPWESPTLEGRKHPLSSGDEFAKAGSGEAAARTEAARLEALARYEILDTDPEPEFDDLTQMAVAMCDAPCAILAFVDAHRVWFKSTVGLSSSQVPREGSGCCETLRRGPVVSRDTEGDPRFASDELVHRDPPFRFFAAVPVLSTEGHAVGLLGVLDYSSRDLSPLEERVLTFLAKGVGAHLERRLRGRPGPPDGVQVVSQFAPVVEPEMLTSRRLSSVVASVSAVVTSGKRLRLTLNRGAELLRASLRAVAVRIWTRESPESRFELTGRAEVTLDNSTAWASGSRMRSLVDIIAQGRVPRVTNDFQNDPLIPEAERVWGLPAGVVSFAGLPLVAGGKLVGVLAVYGRSPLEPFAQEVLEAIARELGEGILRVRGRERAMHACLSSRRFSHETV